MRDPNRLDSLRAAVVTAVATFSQPVIAVYLHGSWATPGERSDSDLDLAVLAIAPIAWEDRLAFLNTLAEELAEIGDIDLADLRRADTVFAARVVSAGERIYCGDPAQADKFEMLALAKYARLNEERAGILADIIRRGTVRGDAGVPT